MIQTIDRELVDKLIGEARLSPRLRTNHNFHQSFDENPHRFLNVMLRGSYFTPHRHLTPPKHESFLVLQGEVGFLEFSDTGEVTKTYRLSPKGLEGIPGCVLCVDIAPGLWHSLVVLSEVAVCFEVKPGPYDPTADKEFATWAPHEGTPGTDDYQRKLLALFEK
jgi:cupin fold WbuC family metalloprotein